MHPQGPDPTNAILPLTIVVLGIVALIVMLLLHGCAAPIRDELTWWEKTKSTLAGASEAEEGEMTTPETAANRTLIGLTVLSLLAAFGFMLTSWLTRQYRRWGAAALACVVAAVLCVALAKVFMVLVWVFLGGTVLFVCWTCWTFRHFDLPTYLRELFHGRM